jgi:hypothetical protein
VSTTRYGVAHLDGRRRKCGITFSRQRLKEPEHNRSDYVRVGAGGSAPEITVSSGSRLRAFCTGSAKRWWRAARHSLAS